MEIKVLVIDDSALMRELLSELINKQEDMRVVGTATDPIAALDKIRQLNPDVLTLDVEMPKMNGLEFLRTLMKFNPMPVVMISSYTESSSEATFQALSIGAVDYLAKPRIDIEEKMHTYEQTIAEKIRSAAIAKLKRKNLQPALGKPALSQKVLGGNQFSNSKKLVLIGCSTGGTEALMEFLPLLPPDFPGVLIVQHIPSGFSRSLAKYLNTQSQIQVKEAEQGETILRGNAYICPGGQHMKVMRVGKDFLIQLTKETPVHLHRPSVDVLFFSAAKFAGTESIGVLLTGMGEDGARGMLEMKNKGAYNIAQDESSSIIFGMPKKAIELKAVHEVLPLLSIGTKLVSYLNPKPVKKFASNVR